MPTLLTFYHEHQHNGHFGAMLSMYPLAIFFTFIYICLVLHWYFIHLVLQLSLLQPVNNKKDNGLVFCMFEIVVSYLSDKDFLIWYSFCLSLQAAYYICTAVSNLGIVTKNMHFAQSTKTLKWSGVLRSKYFSYCFTFINLV